MSRDDWFRNAKWNDKIAEDFEAKLKRAKRKGQYLRIQACTLAKSHPLVALQLLERYFDQSDGDIDIAQAYVDKASALLALGRQEEAIAAYTSALNQEMKMPNVLTQAYIELPYVVSLHALADHYEQAAQLLNLHRKRPTFPVDFFMWHASHALLAGAAGNRNAAAEHAKEALEFASQDKSGLSRHPTIGLVSERHDVAVRRLREYCDA